MNVPDSLIICIGEFLDDKNACYFSMVNKSLYELRYDITCIDYAYIDYTYATKIKKKIINCSELCHLYRFENLRSLHFGHLFNSQIKNVPKTLKDLTFGSWFNNGGSFDDSHPVTFFT